MANRQRGANWSNDETWIIIRICGVYDDRLYLKKNDNPCSSRALFFSGNPNASWQSISEHGAFFPGEPEFVMCQFSLFYYPKVKENKMKP